MNSSQGQVALFVITFEVNFSMPVSNYLAALLRIHDYKEQNIVHFVVPNDHFTT